MHACMHTYVQLHGIGSLVLMIVHHILLNQAYLQLRFWSFSWCIVQFHCHFNCISPITQKWNMDSRSYLPHGHLLWWDICQSSAHFKIKQSFLVITLKEFFLNLGYINQEVYQNMSFSSIFFLFVTCFLIFLALCFSENFNFLMNKN